jgi:ketosteroid isomerase-like protein
MDRGGVQVMTEEQQRNAEVLRTMFAAFERKDFAEADRYVTADNLIEGSTSPDGDLLDQTMTARAQTLDLRYPEWRIRLLDVLPAPGGSSLVGVISTFIRRAGATGGVATLSGAIYRFRDGLICSVRAFSEVDLALRAAGIDPTGVQFSFDRPDAGA